MNFANKTAIILGGIGGIGKEICLQLIRRGVEKLAIIDVVEQETAINSLEKDFESIRFIYKRCSVTEESKLRECMSQIKEELEWVDIIVNSVGVLDETNAQKMIDINYGGVVNSTLIGIDLMRKDQGMRGGTIINIASLASLGAHFWIPVYTGSKHAILGFTRSLKNDKFFEETGIKFMVICPGATNTKLTTPEEFYRKQLFQTMIDEVKSLRQSYARQEVGIVGKCVIDALDDGENGSTWQCDNSRIEKLKITEYPKF